MCGLSELFAVVFSWLFAKAEKMAKLLYDTNNNVTNEWFSRWCLWLLMMMMLIIFVLIFFFLIVVGFWFVCWYLCFIYFFDCSPCLPSIAAIWNRQTNLSTFSRICQWLKNFINTTPNSKCLKKQHRTCFLLVNF